MRRFYEGFGTPISWIRPHGYLGGSAPLSDKIGCSGIWRDRRIDLGNWGRPTTTTHHDRHD